MRGVASTVDSMHYELVNFDFMPCWLSPHLTKPASTRHYLLWAQEAAGARTGPGPRRVPMASTPSAVRTRAVQPRGASLPAVHASRIYTWGSSSASTIGPVLAALRRITQNGLFVCTAAYVLRSEYQSGIAPGCSRLQSRRPRDLQQQTPLGRWCWCWPCARGFTRGFWVAGH